MIKTVLITGADGMIGTRLCNALKDDYTLRLLIRHPLPGGELIVADISSAMSRLIAAFQGVDGTYCRLAVLLFLLQMRSLFKRR